MFVNGGIGLVYQIASYIYLFSRFSYGILYKHRKKFCVFFFALLLKTFKKGGENMKCIFCGKTLDHIDCECHWCTFCGTSIDDAVISKIVAKQ